MDGDRLNERNLVCDNDIIRANILDHDENNHGETIDRMLIAILLILMAIVLTFMAIILRNLRIPWLWSYVGLDG